MQAITHFFSGVFWLAFLRWLQIPAWLLVVLVIAGGIILHFFIDAVAVSTYHPPEALTKDKFWIAWHVIVFAGSVVVAIVFWKPYFWGMLCAIIPDIYDWAIIRPIRTYQEKKQGDEYDESKEFMKGKDFHPLVDRFRQRFLKFLPNLNYAKKGIVPEISIWILCIVGVSFL
ncbi:MAG: hypothetical protein ACTSUE_24255 [Promethearchaeota archaeon]